MCTDTPCVQCSCCRDHTKVCEAQSIFNLLLRSITKLLSSKGDLFTSTDNPIRHHSLARQLHTRTHCCSTRLQCNHDREGWHLCCKRQHHVGSQLRHSTTLIMSRSSLLLCLMLHISCEQPSCHAIASRISTRKSLLYHSLHRGMHMRVLIPLLKGLAFGMLVQSHNPSGSSHHPCTIKAVDQSPLRFLPVICDAVRMGSAPDLPRSR